MVEVSHPGPSASQSNTNQPAMNQHSANKVISNSVNLPVLKFPHIKLAAQNCNSLNISTECDKQLTKIVAITSLCSNIIFLSDLRLGCSAEHSEKIRKMFLTNSSKKYQFFLIPPKVVEELVC